MVSNTVNYGLDCNVLVLNRHYMAIRIIGARRAFSLLFRNLAEVVSCEQGSFYNYDFEGWCELSQLKHHFEHEHHDWIATVNLNIAVPRIIRLLGYDRLPRQEVKLNRRNLFARDENSCQYCGKHFMTRELSIDHVIPKSQGGDSSWENLVCSCVRCNAKKGGRTPKQANMKLIRKPIKPKRNPMIHLHLGSHRYNSWKQFLDNAYWSVALT